MPLITREQLAKLARRAAPRILTGIADHADAVLPQYGISTPLRLSHFMAHVLVESAWLTATEENLNYSAERLCQLWPSRFKTLTAADRCAHKPRELANTVYGGRMGNVGPDDGWRFRGQGLLQVTGRDTFARLAKQLNRPLEDAWIAVTADNGMLECAAATFAMLGCLPFADKDDIVGETRALNGGTNGLDDRRKALAACKALWMPKAPAKPTRKTSAKTAAHASRA